jgi:hypothetical protein
MPCSTIHDRKNFLDEGGRDILVKKVTHRVYENDLRRFPAERKIKRILMGGNPEAVDVIPLAHRLEAAGHPLSITVLTADADFCAPGHRIPGCFGPFDQGS